MLTGSPPFAFPDAAACLNAHIKTPLPRLAQMRPGLRIAPQIETVVRRCLEKYPKERPQTAGELAEAFAVASGCPLTEQTFASDERAAKPQARAEADSRFKIEQSLETKMLEPLAVMKLRGFVNDHHGVVLDNKAGMLSVQFGVRPPAKEESGSKSGVLAWLGKPQSAKPPPPAADPIAMTMQLSQRAEQRGQLKLSIVFKPLPGRTPANATQWRESCDQLFYDLRSYMMVTATGPGQEVDSRWR